MFILNCFWSKQVYEVSSWLIAQEMLKGLVWSSEKVPQQGQFENYCHLADMCKNGMNTTEKLTLKGMSSTQYCLCNGKTQIREAWKRNIHDH